MYTDYLPIPSKGMFYPLDDYGDRQEYLEVGYLTTEDELMMTSTNLFAKGDILYKLLEKKVCKYNNITLDELLINDKEFILLWLREMAYGNIIEYADNKERFMFDTADIGITYLKTAPDKFGCYQYTYRDCVFNLKLLTIRDERVFKIKGKNNFNFYLSHIKDINGNTDREYIKKVFGNMPFLEGRKLKDFIKEINFGVAEYAFCYSNDKRLKTTIEINENFLGFTQNNLPKTNKMLNDSIIYLLNEGQGYTQSDVLSMPCHIRIYNIERLSEKISKINESIPKR